MIDDGLLQLAAEVASMLREKGETVAVAEGSCGGLLSAALVAVPGASAYFVGGAVIYTPTATRAFVRGAIDAPQDLRGASEAFAQYLAESVRQKLGATWGIGEGGATGPSGNPYGDPPGHMWAAVAGPTCATRHVLTGNDDRLSNMSAFALEALSLFRRQLVQPLPDQPAAGRV